MIKVPIVPFYPTTLCELNATIRPSLRDGSFFAVFQAINCLATIIQSLRDNKPPSQFSTKATPPYYIAQRAILLTVGNSAG